MSEKRFFITEQEVKLLDEALLEMRRKFPIGTMPEQVDTFSREFYDLLCTIIFRSPTDLVAFNDHSVLEHIARLRGIVGGVEYIIDNDKLGDADKIERIRWVLEAKNNLGKEQAPYEVSKP